MRYSYGTSLVPHFILRGLGGGNASRLLGGQTKKEQQCHLVGWLPTFDNIKQKRLLEKMKTYPQMRKHIKGWLEAGVVDNEVFISAEAGTPQGGVISPLLANIALHGMEEACQSIKTGKEKPVLIRYADDFVGATRCRLC